jgi:hypothetical protein
MARFFSSPDWRFVITNLGGTVLTFLDRLAANRTITYTLNDPAIATASVPADNPEINIASDEDGLLVPYVAPAERLLYAFRREVPSSGPPWVCRFAGVLSQVNDEITVSTDVPTSHLTAYDPLAILKFIPVFDVGGTLPGQGGRTFASTTADQIILELLNAALVAGTHWEGFFGLTIPLAAKNFFLNWGQPAYASSFTGTIATARAVDSAGINFPQGMMIADAIKQLTDGGYCDILITPVFDQVSQAGLCGQLNIYPGGEAGSIRNVAQFAWDKPGRSLVGMNRMKDGAQLATIGVGFAGQGGVAVLPPVAATDPIPFPAGLKPPERFGWYWIQSFYATLRANPAIVATLVTAQIALRQQGLNTLTIDPAPELSPIVFEEYFLGDRVPVFSSNSFREAINAGVVSAGQWTNLQRIYQIPISIPDDSVENVAQLLMTGPVLT